MNKLKEVKLPEKRALTVDEIISKYPESVRILLVELVSKVESLQKKPIKLYEANIKWLEDIIEIVLANVSCEHQEIEEHPRGPKHDDVSYTVDDQVMIKALEAIPDLPLKFSLKVDEKFIIEKGCEASRFYSVSCKTVEDSRNFIRSFIKELVDKIKFNGGNQ